VHVEFHTLLKNLFVPKIDFPNMFNMDRRSGNRVLLKK
jgi:hypothetical protein